eukprot:14735132-Ditylum_brightwellii.AAC.1
MANPNGQPVMVSKKVTEKRDLEKASMDKYCSMTLFTDNILLGVAPAVEGISEATNITLISVGQFQVFLLPQ